MAIKVRPLSVTFEQVQVFHGLVDVATVVFGIGEDDGARELAPIEVPVWVDNEPEDDVLARAKAELHRVLSGGLEAIGHYGTAAET